MKPKKYLSIISLIVLILCVLSQREADGQILVLNVGDGTIGKYGFDGVQLKSPVFSGLKDSGAFAQIGDKLFVANRIAGTIDEYTTNGEVVRLGIISGPSLISIAASDSNLFVLSSVNGTIGKYKLDGTVVNAALISGLKSAPTAIAISGSNLFVLNFGLNSGTNSGTGSISLYTMDGKLVNDSLVSNLNGPHTIAICGSNIYVPNGGSGTIGKYSTSGTTINASLISGLEGPLGIAATDTRIFVTTSGGVVGVYTTDGKRVNDALITGLKIPINIIASPSREELAAIPKQAKATHIKEDHSQPPKSVPSLPPPSPRMNLPPVIVDSYNYGTENNWLAHHIALRVTTLCYLALHPDAKTAPDIKIKAAVNAKAQTVDLTITNFSKSPVTVELKPDFAWDPVGYAPLASQLLGDAFRPSYTEVESSVDCLTQLLNLNGPELAKADLALSAELQNEPTWADGHEQAALLLVSLALRDRAGEFTDYRQILCRATAHLAVAQALRKKQPLGWAGQIADAGIRALSGREVDALSKLDGLVARTDSPDNAKTWLAALRLRTSGDWRTVQVDSNSPLLLKIVLAHVLAEDLTSMGAQHRLKALGPLPEMPDWGRCALTSMNGVAVETGNTYAPTITKIELAELKDIMQIEKSPFDVDIPSNNFSKPLQEEVLTGSPGILQIIGPEMFRDATRRHLLSETEMTSYWLADMLGIPAEAEKYAVHMRELWKGTRLFEAVQFKMDDDGASYQFLVDLGKKQTHWEPWELMMGNLLNLDQLVYPDSHTLHGFYADGLPFGTSYDLYYRQESLLSAQWIEDDKHPEVFHVEPDISKEQAEIFRKLAPGAFIPITIGNLSVLEQIRLTKPMWDYNLQPLLYFEHSLGGMQVFNSPDANSFLKGATDEERKIDPVQRQTEFFQKEVALDTNAYFKFGAWLRLSGKIDEAADMDRKGFDQAYDQVGMSNCVGPLVDYYYDHNRLDEAKMVAKRASEIGSSEGLLIYSRLLDKLGHVDEAEQRAKNLNTRYNDPSNLLDLYKSHAEHFQDHTEALKAALFPHGFEKVDIASLSNQPPISGCQLSGSSQLMSEAKLRSGDIIVACNSLKVENAEQYTYLAADSKRPSFELVVWRDKAYIKITVSTNDKTFGVNLKTYTSDQSD